MTTFNTTIVNNLRFAKLYQISVWDTDIWDASYWDSFIYDLILIRLKIYKAITNKLNISSKPSEIYLKNGDYFYLYSGHENLLNAPLDTFSVETATSATWTEVSATSATWVSI